MDTAQTHDTNCVIEGYNAVRIEPMQASIPNLLKCVSNFLINDDFFSRPDPNTAYLFALILLR